MHTTHVNAKALFLTRALKAAIGSLVLCCVPSVLWGVPETSPSQGMLDQQPYHVVSEHYFELLHAARPVGFAVEQYLFHPQKKEYVSISISYSSTRGQEHMESLEAHATHEMHPIAYNYSFSVHKNKKLQSKRSIKARVKAKKVLHAKETVVDQSLREQRTSKRVPLEEGVFFSSFLAPMLMFKSPPLPEGVKKKNLKFKAIAEENMQISPGHLQLRRAKGKNFALKVHFGGRKFKTKLAPTGALLSSFVPGPKVQLQFTPVKVFKKNWGAKVKPLLIREKLQNHLFYQYAQALRPNHGVQKH